MLNQTMQRIKRNLKLCLTEMDDALESCEDLLWNNNIIILVDAKLYHNLKKSYHDLVIIRTCLFSIYEHLEQEYSAFVLDLTIEGHDLIRKISNYIKQIEEQWEAGDIDLNKYLFAQAALRLFNEEVILDIDDLEEIVRHSSDYWLCPYLVHEGKYQVCHYSAWKTKQDAYLFAMQMSGCGMKNVFNRFKIQD